MYKNLCPSCGVKFDLSVQQQVRRLLREPQARPDAVACFLATQGNGYACCVEFFLGDPVYEERLERRAALSAAPRPTG